MTITSTSILSSPQKTILPLSRSFSLRKTSEISEVPPVSERAKISLSRPFDEFNVSDEEVEKLREDIRKQGFCRIKFSEETLKLFSEKISEIEAENKSKSHSKIYKIYKILKPFCFNSYFKVKKRILLNEYIQNMNSLHLKLSEDYDLRLLSFDIEQFALRKKPQPWHYDGGMITCLATLKGKPTEYISLEDEKNKFEQHSKKSNWKILKPKENLEIHKTEEGYCYFYLGDQYKGSLPKLLHRGPKNMDSERTIFAGVWYIPYFH